MAKGNKKAFWSWIKGELLAGRCCLEVKSLASDL